MMLCMTLDMGTPTRRRIPEIRLHHRLAIALQEADMDRQTMAAELGIHRNSVHNYAAGRSKPSKSVVLHWALLTGIDPHWLLTGETPGHDPEGGESTSGYSRATGPAECVILPLVA